jgi:tellurite resistance protein
MSAVPAGISAQGGQRLRVPPNAFGIAFGLAGLAEAWRAVGPVLGIPSGVPDALFILTALVWIILIGAYAAQGPTQLQADLRDPVLAPFLSLPSTVGMILGGSLATVAFTAGQVLVIVFLVITVGLGGWLFGQWVVGDIDHDQLHPGYFLPTVAGMLVGASTAIEVHLHAAADVAFGIGIISWLLLGSTVLNRIFFHPSLPAALVPTLAIEIAPPAVAGVAYFALTRGTINVISYALGGYAVLMAVMQLRLVPLYLRLRFSISTWSFTFSYAIAIVYALEWITITKVAGSTAYAAVAVALITVLIGGISVRTVIATMRGQLLPTAPTPAIPAQKRPQLSTQARQRRRSSGLRH